MLVKALAATFFVNSKAFLVPIRSGVRSPNAVMNVRHIETPVNLHRTQVLTSSSPADFVVASYNVDGLSDDHANCKRRCLEISRLVCDEAPDVIFFQEVTPQTLLSFAPSLKPFGYNVASSVDSHSSPYFNVAFSKVNGICRRLAFSGAAASSMGRDMIVFETVVNGRKVQVMSSHLESLADYGAAREAQLEVMLDSMQNFQGPSIVAGDLNVRNKEAEKVLRKVAKKTEGRSADTQLFDCWEAMGKIEGNKNTWVHGDPGLKHIQARYDRIYCNGKSARVIGFKLIGKEVMPPPCLTTPSDHYGMIAKFSIEKADDFSTDSMEGSRSDTTGDGAINSMSIKESGVATTASPKSKKAKISKSLDVPVMSSLSTPTPSASTAVETKKRKKSPLASDAPADAQEETRSRRAIMANAATKRLQSKISLSEDAASSSSSGEHAVDGACEGKGRGESVDNAIDSKKDEALGDQSGRNSEHSQPNSDSTCGPVILDLSNSPE